MAEVHEGYVTGPFDARDVPNEAVVVPCFGLQQKNKLRPIDNYTAAGTNLAVGTTEKLQIDSIDELAAMIKGWMQSSGGGLELVGRTFDFRKAYRQMGICSEHLHASWLCVFGVRVKGESSTFTWIRCHSVRRLLFQHSFVYHLRENDWRIS